MKTVPGPTGAYYAEHMSMEQSKGVMYYPRKEFLAVDKTKHGLDDHFFEISYKDSFR